MNLTEIKKALYKEKPIANCIHKGNYHFKYRCRLEDNTKINFSVPVADMGDLPFGNQEQGQLLIRYIDYD